MFDRPESLLNMWCKSDYLIVKWRFFKEKRLFSVSWKQSGIKYIFTSGEFALTVVAASSIHAWNFYFHILACIWRYLGWHFPPFSSGFQVKREELLLFAQNAITGLKINYDLARFNIMEFLSFLSFSFFILYVLVLVLCIWVWIADYSFSANHTNVPCVYVENDGIYIQNKISWTESEPLKLSWHFSIFLRCIYWWLFFHVYKVSMGYFQNYEWLRM